MDWQPKSARYPERKFLEEDGYSAQTARAYAIKLRMAAREQISPPRMPPNFTSRQPTLLPKRPLTQATATAFEMGKPRPMTVQTSQRLPYIGAKQDGTVSSTPRLDSPPPMPPQSAGHQGAGCLSSREGARVPVDQSCQTTPGFSGPAPHWSPRAPERVRPLSSKSLAVLSQLRAPPDLRQSAPALGTDASTSSPGRARSPTMTSEPSEWSDTDAPPSRNGSGLEPGSSGHYTFYVDTQTSAKLCHLDTFTYETTCEWDQDEKELADDVLSPNMKFNRMYYTWSCRKKGPQAEMSAMRQCQVLWQAFCAAQRVSLEEFAEWMTSLRPRSVHDYKPLVVLLQGALQTLLGKEVHFFSRENLEMQADYERQLADLADQLDVLEGEKKKNRRRESKAKWTQGSHKAALKRKDQSAALQVDARKELREVELERLRAAHEQAMRELAEQKDMQIAALREQLVREREASKAKFQEAAEKARAELQIAKDQLLAEKNRQKPETRDQSTEPEDHMEDLNALFGEGGAWTFVSSMEEMHQMAAVACNLMHSKYGVRCEVTKLTYDMALDPDGDDDPDTYDDNMVEVLHSWWPDHKPGSYVNKMEADDHYTCANSRSIVRTADHLIAPVVVKRAIPTTRWPDGHPLGESWGMVEVQPGGAKMIKPMVLFAEGMSKIINKLADEEEAVLLKNVATVANIGSGRRQGLRWTKVPDQMFRAAIHRVHLRNVLMKENTESEQASNAGGIGVAGVVRMGQEAQIRLGQGVALTPEERARQRAMERLREAHESLVQLQRARLKLGDLLKLESIKSKLVAHRYLHANPCVVEVFMGLFTTLGYTELWKRVCKVPKNVPRDEVDTAARVILLGEHQAAWRHIGECFVVEDMLKVMQTFEPGLNLPYGTHTEYEEGEKVFATDVSGPMINITERRNNTVQTFLDKIDTMTAIKVSLALGLVHEWNRVTLLMTTTLQRQRELQQELGVEVMEFEWFVSCASGGGEPKTGTPTLATPRLGTPRLGTPKHQ